MIISAIKKSVFAKLLLPYIILFVFAFTMLGFIITQQLYRMMLDRNNIYAASTLLQINHNLENSIKQIDEKIKNLYTAEYFDYNIVHYLRDESVKTDIDKVRNENAITRQLAYLKNSNSNIVGVILYKYTSNSIYSTWYPGVKTTYDFNKYVYLDNIKQKEYGLFISPICKPDYYINYTDYTITLARNIIDIDFQVRRAFVLVDVGINIFRDIFKQYRNELNGNVIFLDKDSNVYFDLRETMIGKSFVSSTGIDIDFNTVVNGENVHREKVLLNGENHYLYILNSKLIEGKVLYLISENDLLRGIGRIKADLIFVMVVSIIAVILSFTAISRLFANRVRKMAQSIELIGEGKLDTRVEVKGDDELAQLAASFNKMCVRLKEFIDRVYITELKNRELEIREKNAEMKALQMQINPHFLFNTLEAIKINILLGETAEAAEMIRILAGIFRWNVKSGESIVTLEEELIYSMSYLDLQKIRLKDRLETIYEISEKVKNVKVIKLILQPIIENAVAHGIECKEKGGQIVIKASKEDDLVVIHVIDNGPGMSAEKLESIRSEIYSDDEPVGSYKIGLRNVNERIKIYFGSQYGIKINSFPGEGTDVSITLPYNVDVR
ncbi:MAG TPA: sensor histidine kinase [Clostridiaceae bacterium]|nr:sensor histidine kinase [Clostridiaceae bacterium]